MLKLKVATVALLVITLTALIFSVPKAYSASAKLGNVIYFVTDSYDLEFLRDFLKKYYMEYSILTLNNISEIAKIDPKGKVLVLLDPNINSYSEMKTVGEYIAEYCLEGGVTVATFNGLVLLNTSSKTAYLGVKIRENIHIPKTFYPVDYNVSKYRFAEISSPNLKRYSKLVYGLKYGLGYIVALPINPVWAYHDTKNPLYLELVFSAIEKALAETYGKHFENRSNAFILIVGFMAITFIIPTVSSSTAFSSLKEKVRKIFVIPLWSKIKSGEALSHDVRRKIVEILREKHFVNFNSLQNILKVGKGSLSWHLYVLERSGHIETFRFKNKLFIYIPGNEETILKTLLLEEKSLKKILANICYSEATIEEVASKHRVSVSSLNELMKWLCSKGFVERKGLNKYVCSEKTKAILEGA